MRVGAKLPLFLCLDQIQAERQQFEFSGAGLFGHPCLVLRRFLPRLVGGERESEHECEAAFEVWK